jgi:predicted amidohydrolase
VKVAAYQAPLLPAGSTTRALRLIRRQIAWCETAGVEMLCCPEGVLGGLADYANHPAAFALDAERQLREVLEPLASDRVTTIVGFTEVDRRGRLYNAAAVWHKGSVAGLYRKLHPAINGSVYEPGCDTRVFIVGGLTFGIVICRDSVFSEPARRMAAQGAAVLFVPTNNGMPVEKGGSGLVAEARNVDIDRATENGMSVVRADVAGRIGELVSYGSSGIVDRAGTILASSRPLEADLLVAEVAITPRRMILENH